MPRKFASPMLQLLRRTLEDEQVRDLPDHELLTRLGGQRDVAAFDGLLRRHGPMVLEVCRSVLGNEDDAEDAFQATFLILVRKAGAIRKKSSVGSWLHGVAYRTALKARASFARRHKHETRRAIPLASESADEATWRDVQQTLHSELNRFSERYRAPLVLCYLEGKTQDEAAGVLGVSKATLKKHLERARALLRARLVRRGLGPTAVLAAAAWPAGTSSAAVPPALAAALFDAVTKPLGSSRVATLTEGVLRAMFYTKLRLLAAATAAFALLPLLGALAFRGHAEAGEPPALDVVQSAPSDEPKKEQAKKAEKDELSGEWTNTDAKKDGRIRLLFGVGFPGARGDNVGKSLILRWTPPPTETSTSSSSSGSTTTGPGSTGAIGAIGAGGGVGTPPPGAAIGFRFRYEIKENDGKKVLVLIARNDENLEVPYKLDGDTLTLDGGTYEPGKRNNRPGLAKIELKGSWKRVDVDLEKKFRQASSDLADIERFAIRVESRSQRLLIAANEAVVQPEGQLRLKDCVVVRLPATKDEPATIIRSGHALIKLNEPARSVTDVGRGIVSVEFPGGVRMNLEQP